VTDKHPDLLERIRLRLEESFAGIDANVAEVGLWGTLVGSMLPMALERAGMDPAVSSAPFVATLVDVTGIVIDFEVAARVLRGTLL
jgi:magnesium transporter